MPISTVSPSPFYTQEDLDRDTATWLPDPIVGDDLVPASPRPELLEGQRVQVRFPRSSDFYHRYNGLTGTIIHHIVSQVLHPGKYRVRLDNGFVTAFRGIRLLPIKGETADPLLATIQRLHRRQAFYQDNRATLTAW